MNKEMKAVLAVTFLILGLLQGTNVAVNEELRMGGILRTVLLLVAAVLFYLWLMRDERSADEAAGESMDEIEKQLDVVKEAVQETTSSTTEQAADVVDTKAEAATPKPAAEKPTPEPAEEPKPEPVAATSGEPDDFTKIEGIGPSYRDILIGAGVDTYAKLAAMSEDEIVKLVRDNGGRRSRSMATWAEQAKLAAAGDWDGLAKLQESLSGGAKT